MKALDLKLLRDLWRIRGQALAIALVVGAATATFVMSLGVYRSVMETRDIYYERNHFADVFSGMTRAPRSIVGRVEAIEGVRRAEGRITQYATLDIPGRVDSVRAVINSVGEGGETELNRLTLVAGRGPRSSAAGEIVIDEAFAEANGFAPGDEIDALIYGTRERLTVVGIGLAPDYIYAIAPGELIPDESRFGIFWMGERALEAATNRTEAINFISMTLERDASEAEVIRRLDAILAPFGGTGAYGRDDHPSNAFVDNELMQLDVMTTTIPPVFLVVSTFLVYIVLGRLISTEREQIGLLKAFGYTDGAVAWHYLKFALAISALGVLLGWAAGAWMGRGMTAIYADLYRFPFLYYRISPSTFMIAALLAAGSAVLGAMGGVRTAIGLTPAIAMAPPQPPIYKTGFLERMGQKAGFTSIGHMIVRHIGRWPVRSAITVFGVALSLGLLFSTMQFLDGTNEMLEANFFRAQNQDLTVALIEAGNEEVLHNLASIPGVLRVEATRAAAARLRNGHRSERVAIESASSDARLWSRIDASGREIPLPPAGLMLSGQLAAKLNVQAGDRIEIDMLEGRRIRTQIPVVTTIDEYIGSRAYADSATLERLTRDDSPVGSALLRIDPVAREDILDELRDMPIVLGVTERRATLDKFREMIDDNIITMIGFYIAFASAIVIGVVYNSARIVFSERARELATLRVLGYHKQEVGLILLGQIALLVALAVPVGCLTGYWLGQGLASAFSSDLFRLPFAPTRGTYGFSIVVVLIAAALTALIVARRVARLDMVRVLKARD
ncbi:FtsX-like permease family protein [Parasphingopyxis algicola]|uniref:ABC transporter permease n=1 Tax=Parasphingopyxis algicola TaxID=2026624 RepID=UPI0015A4CC27|nr:FtsX-like permease family protein [Parasphingopyxis algicola]QLC25350.1 FtsX-like permease family protein [Parasphingopyxis algicola]